MKNSKNHGSMNKVAVKLIYIYQVSLSYFLGGNCRFYPSCSCYAIESYKKFNFLKATILTTKRVCRCHPFSKADYYDPIPS